MDTRIGDDSPTGNEPETVLTRFDTTRDEPTAEIVDAVARATGRDPLEIDPLYDVVDPDALAGILRGGTGHDLVVSFTLSGCLVRASPDGWIAVTEDE